MEFADIDKMVEVLESGGLIIYPTDTIWGIGCDALNETAIQKVYALKERDDKKPLIVLVADLDMLKTYVPDIHPRIESLLFYHEKPLTVIYQNALHFPDILRGEKGSIGVRIVQDAYCREFIGAFGKPIVSTSINLSGEPAPVHFAEISFDMLDRVDYVSMHRRKDVFESNPSSIIRYNASGKITFLR